MRAAAERPSEDGDFMTRDEVIATLRAHELELKGAGIRILAVFGSVARGEAGHDVDLLAAFDDALHPLARRSRGVGTASISIIWVN